MLIIRFYFMNQRRKYIYIQQKNKSIQKILYIISFINSIILSLKHILQHYRSSNITDSIVQ